MSKKHIAVFGGTFDPPHNGHLNLAHAVLDELHPDKLIVIPTFKPTYKESDADSASPQMRLEMAKLAFNGLPDTEVSDIELTGQGSGFTSDTLRQLMLLEPEACYTLVLGSDKLRGISSWHEAQWIFKNTDIAVLNRGIDDEGIYSDISEIKNKFGAKITALDALPLDISSSKLRRELSEGNGSEFIPPSVMRFILRERLYNVSPNADWLRSHALSGLGQHRLLHTLGCEYEAVLLARRWGANEKDARTAAILHDCTKAVDRDGQLKLCREYGITIDSALLDQYKLLHAITGAAVAKHDYAVNDAVYEAIRWHTTGKPDMSILEKVMYIADFIEPGRDFEGVEAVRRLAYKDIDEALIAALTMSLEEVRSNGIIPHGDTVEALEYLVAAKDYRKDDIEC